VAGIGYTVSVAGATRGGSPAAFELTGGALCLDFANTLGDRPRCREERLESYQDLLAWSRQAGALAAPEVSALHGAALRHARRARRALGSALALRERLYGIFSALARGPSPAAADVEALNQALARILGRLRLVRRKDGYGWGWSGEAAHLERMLWPVARSAAELLTSEEARDVRECASGDCSWLFVDRSRTRRRRWCDMRTCGNRNKARRHYERLKARSVSSRRSP